MRRRNMVALGIFFVFYISFGILLTLHQEKFIYRPMAQDFDSCVAFENAEKINYKGTRMYMHEGDRGMVVFYHGNFGSACDRYFYADQFMQADYGYLIVEYAGYSNDSQTPTHDVIKQDVRNVISFIEKMGYEHVVIIGESIGSGVASFHASLQTPNNILLISPFKSLADIARRQFWFYPTFLLVDNAFDNANLLIGYKGPITIMHGDEDMLIPQKSGLKLYKSLSSKEKRFVSIGGYGHNNLFTTQESREVISSFLKE